MPYDSSTGRIYIGGTQQSPVGISVADVNAVIQAGSLDVGTLCTSGHVNPWAKYKPFRSNQLNPTAPQKQDRNYGLYIPYYTTIGGMVGDMYNNRWTNAANYSSSRLPWAWEKPRGYGETNHEWYRLLDFNEYKHSVRAFVEQCASTAVIPVNDSAANFVFPYHYDERAIAPSDLYPELNDHSVDTLNTMYLGVCVFWGTGSAQRKSWTLGPASNYDNNALSNISASLTGVSGSVQAMLFLANQSKAVDGSEASGKYIPIEESLATVQITMEEWNMSNLSVVAGQDRTTVGVDWSVVLTNTAGHAATVECRYYYEQAGVEYEATTIRDTTTVNLVPGTNTGNFDKTGVNYILTRAVLTITITDSVHGTRSINQSVAVEGNLPQ